MEFRIHVGIYQRSIFIVVVHCVNGKSDKGHKNSFMRQMLYGNDIMLNAKSIIELLKKFQR